MILRTIKLIITVMAIIITVSGCMDNSMATNTFSFTVDASGSWTLRIDAEYSDGWKSHYVNGNDSEALRLGSIIGTDQRQWTASFNKDVDNVSVLYEGDVVYDGSLKEGKKITWP